MTVLGLRELPRTSEVAAPIPLHSLVPVTPVDKLSAPGFDPLVAYSQTNEHD